MTCIDCQLEHAITVTQERRVFSRTCTWQICPSCLSAYQRVTQEITREREAKAMGRTQAGKSVTPKRATNDNAQQGVLA